MSDKNKSFFTTFYIDITGWRLH